ncbi:MAG: hypothetical protein ACO39Y_12300, partial [Ilumatobacteraceae bacterium]
MTVLFLVVAVVVGVVVGIVVERRRRQASTRTEAAETLTPSDSGDVLLEQAIDALGIGVVVVSADGEIVFENAIAGG